MSLSMFGVNLVFKDILFNNENLFNVLE